MSKYTKSAAGQECQIRIPGYCNFNPDTTVFAHIGGAGMGAKTNNIAGSYACSTCHDLVDYRDSRWQEIPIDSLKRMHLDGVMRTQELMIKAGVLKL